MKRGGGQCDKAEIYSKKEARAAAAAKNPRTIAHSDHHHHAAMLNECRRSGGVCCARRQVQRNEGRNEAAKKRSTSKRFMGRPAKPALEAREMVWPVGRCLYFGRGVCRAACAYREVNKIRRIVAEIHPRLVRLGGSLLLRKRQS